MKILSIVGARPEFIQATPVSSALRKDHQEILVHTGQHYDYRMSQAFFEDLDIPDPDYNLEVKSGSHGKQTAEILARLEEVLIKEQPELVIVRGDTNSTLAAAMAAVKLHIPVAHVEAGERSFDRRMPEEINRILTDRIADIHFCASQTAVRQLSDEGITNTVYWVGDVMLDALLQNLPVARRKSNILERLELQPKGYSLVTVHRAATTDNPGRLADVVQALGRVEEIVVFPVHPRTRNALDQFQIKIDANVHLVDPVGYFDMMILEENARLIATDSGGVQREAYFLNIPCLTLRDETEWTETVTTGWNLLVGTNPEKIVTAWSEFAPPAAHPDIFGHGYAGEKIAQLISELQVTFDRPGFYKTPID